MLLDNCTSHGAFAISSDVTIDGSSAGLVRIGRGRGVMGTFDTDTTSTIEQGNVVQLSYCLGRVFDVATGANVEIVNAVIQGGDVRGDFFQDPAQGNGGGIQNAGNLTLRDSVVGSNHLRSASAFFKGGGIYNGPTGELTLVNTHVGGNPPKR